MDDYVIIKNMPDYTLACSLCGEEYQISLPCSLNIFTASAQQFIADHRRCRLKRVNPLQPVVVHDVKPMRIITNWRNAKYACSYEWPDDCHLQFGERGVVFSRDVLQTADPVDVLMTALAPDTARTAGPLPFYTTAFFEAFPRNPNTFIRGEGETVEAAEREAWGQWQLYSACIGHEFEARGYENGGGICRHCGMFSSQVIAPVHPCQNCGTLTWFAKDNQDGFWCQVCYPLIPLSRLTEEQRYFREWYPENP